MNNTTLVDAVARNERYLQYKSPRDPHVLEALLKVDRTAFLSDEYSFYIPYDYCDLAGMDGTGICTSRDAAYFDLPVDIGYFQTCSAPSMVALMADLLELQLGMNVLEIGTGCGYHAAVTAELVGKAGKVTSIEFVPELAEQAQRNLEAHFSSSTSSRVRVICGDGSQGFSPAALYDRIYFTAGVRIFYAFEDPVLVEQLSATGIMLIPQQEGPLVKVHKTEGCSHVERIGYFGFVPLQESC